MRKVPYWEAVDPRFAEIARQMNTIVDSVNSGAELTGAKGASTANTTAGKSILIKNFDNVRLSLWPGVIRSTGPAGEADFTDARYWVRPGYIDQSGTTHDTDETYIIPEDNDDAKAVVATNQTEAFLAHETHTLQPDQPVLVLSIYGRASDDSELAVQNVFFASSSTDVRRFVQITGTTLKSGQLAKWDYAFAEVTDNWTPDDVPQIIPGGLTGTMANTLEGNNPSSGKGQMMSGPYVSDDDFDNGVVLQPCVVGAVYELFQNRTCASTGSGTGSGSGSGATSRYYFIGHNVKAECPDGP